GSDATAREEGTQDGFQQRSSGRGGARRRAARGAKRRQNPRHPVWRADARLRQEVRAARRPVDEGRGGAARGNAQTAGRARVVCEAGGGGAGPAAEDGKE